MKDRSSIVHVLRLLENLQEVSVIHRDVGTRQELDFYAKRWTQKQYDNYKLGYLAFHGEPGCLWVGQERVALHDVAKTLARKCTGRVIY